MRAHRTVSTALMLLAGALAAGPASAVETIRFNNVIVGATSYRFGDVVFSTADPDGFTTTGPGFNQSFIDEPGLEGTSLLMEDLRVDFEAGAVDFIRFGFALSSEFEGPDVFATFSLFDASDALIATTTVPGLFTLPDGVDPSGFPEGQVELDFDGEAAYGIFDFGSDGRYIIDDFTGEFGMIPEPATGLLLLGGLLGLSGRRRSRRA